MAASRKSIEKMTTEGRKVYKYRGVYFVRIYAYGQRVYQLATKFYDCTFCVQELETIKECKRYINTLIYEYKVNVNSLRKISEKFKNREYSYTDNPF